MNEDALRRQQREVKTQMKERRERHWRGWEGERRMERQSEREHEGLHIQNIRVIHTHHYKFHVCWRREREREREERNVSETLTNAGGDRTRSKRGETFEATGEKQRKTERERERLSKGSTNWLC